MDTKKMSGNSLITDALISFIAGVVLFFLTGISQGAIVFVFALYAIAQGATQMVAATGERDDNKNVFYLVLIGLYSVGSGVALMFFTGAALSTVVMLIAAYVAVTGIAEIIAAYAYRREMNGYAWLIGSGLVRAIFGVFLFLNSATISLSTLILSVAIYALVEGLMIGVFGYEIRNNMGKYDKPISI